jgi:hypothetical protein
MNTMNTIDKIPCKQLISCITRAIVYAEHDDFQQGRASFISDLSKSPCTKAITKKPMFSITMLFGEITTLDEFKNIINIVSLCHECTCFK